MKAKEGASKWTHEKQGKRTLLTSRLGFVGAIFTLLSHSRLSQPDLARGMAMVTAQLRGAGEANVAIEAAMKVRVANRVLLQRLA
jgi:hypothetical protein